MLELKATLIHTGCAAATGGIDVSGLCSHMIAMVMFMSEILLQPRSMLMFVVHVTKEEHGDDAASRGRIDMSGIQCLLRP